MKEKQIIIYFKNDTFENIKKKCSQTKRSLVAQACFLIEKVPDNNEDLFNYLKWKFSRIKQDSVSDIKTSIKLPEKEYWSATRKAAGCFLKISDFIYFILILWEKNDLPVEIFRPENQTGAGKKEKKLLYEIGGKNGIKSIEGIELSYDLKGHDIKVYWKAKCLFSGELWLVFIKPDTKNIIGEYFLGSRLEGEMIFNTKDLGIDLEWSSSFPIIVTKDKNL